MALPLARFKAWVLGQLVASADLLAIQTQVRSLIGGLSFGIAGTSAYLPGKNALGVTAPGGMMVTVGGADELVFLPDPNSASLAKVAYSTGAVNQPINAADPNNPRHDLICIQFSNPQVNGHDASVRNGANVTTQTVYDVDETFSIQYAEGIAAASPADPPVPNGWVALARVVVPNAAAAIGAADITILLPTIPQLIANYLFGTAGVGFTQGPGITLTPTNNAQGETVALEIANAGVLSVQGIAGAVTFESPDNSILVGTSGQNVTLEVAPSSTAQTQVQYGFSPPLNSSFGHEFSFTLPGTAADTWNLYASVAADTSSGNSLSLSGTGATAGSGSWNSGASAGSGFKSLEIYGQAPGGTAITVSASCSGVNGSSYSTLFRAVATKA